MMLLEKAASKVLKGTANVHQEKTDAQDNQRMTEQMSSITDHTNGANAEAAKHLRDAERSRTKRTVFKGAIGAAIVGGLIYGVNSCANSIGKALIPHVEITTQEDINTALQNVKLSQDTIILTGTGTSKVDVSDSFKVGWLGMNIGIPFSGEDAGANIKANLNVISQAGAVALQGVENNGQWQTLASINVKQLKVGIDNETHTLTGSDQFAINLGNALGMPTETNERHNLVLGMAENNFEATCAQPLTNAQVLAAAEANYIHSEIVTVEEATTNNPSVHSALQELANQPILIEYVNPAKKAGSPAEFVSPASVELALPKLLKTETINTPAITVDIKTSGETCMLTPQAADQLEAIKNGTNFVLEQQPYNLNG